MWFQRNKLDTNTGKVVLKNLVKPARAGSSIGVTVAYGVADSLRKANKIVTEEIDHKVLVEIFLEGGREFTAIVLDVGTGVECCPVALLPTEVELQVNDDIDLKEKDATAYSVGCSGNQTWRDLLDSYSIKRIQNCLTQDAVHVWQVGDLHQNEMLMIMSSSLVLNSSSQKKI